MNYMIATSSKTGNTRQLADALAADLAGAEGATCVYAGPADAPEAAAALAQADTVLVGFWCDKGDCAPDAADLLGRLGGKRVFLFGTAGFGGAPEYFDRILATVSKHLPAVASYLGGAMCQGKMPASVRARYQAMLADKPGDARIQAMIDNFDAALPHPTADDCAQVAAAARAALGL